MGSEYCYSERQIANLSNLNVFTPLFGQIGNLSYSFGQIRLTRSA